MPAIYPNFCRLCGGALSPQGKSLESFAANCAACRRAAARFRNSRQHHRWLRLSAVGVGAMLAVLVAFGFMRVASVPVLPPRPAMPMMVVPESAPTPSLSPAVMIPQTVRDPIRDGWQGSFLLHTRANVASIFVNGQPIFRTTQAGTFIAPPTTLRLNDLVVFEVAAPSGVMRAAFMTSDGKQQIPLRAADLRDLGEATAASPLEFATYHDSPAAVVKIGEMEVSSWEKSGANPVPHGSEYVNGKNTGTYHLGFVVSPQIFCPLKASTLSDHMLFLFDDVGRSAACWKWKANFTMNTDGASGPPEPDNELVSRFMLDGDFALDLDADFGQAAYTNTGGMLVALCGQEIGFDGGWNFGSWGGSTVRIRVQRLGEELQLIRDGQVLIVPIADAERDKPTAWRLWWRSRSSHFRGIKVSADRIINAN